MISNKELVKRAIEFRSPERVPYNFDSNRTPAIEVKYGDDFEWVFSKPPEPHPSLAMTEMRYETEYGIVYQRFGKTFGEAQEHPLADLTRVDAYQLPDVCHPARFTEMEKIVQEHPDQYILAMFPHFLFQHMLDLFGFENLMIALLTERKIVERVADQLTESCLAVVDRFADRGADGMIAIEDLGLQNQLIISPALWRQVFKPRMAAIVQKCHSRNLHFFSHTCGGILEVIEDFISIGVDVLQIDQQDNMGIDELCRRYAGRMCFFCPVDIQTTLPIGTARQIEDKAKHLMKAFGSHAGGFMAKTYPQPEAIEIPEINTKIMCEAFRKYGRYPFAF